MRKRHREKETARAIEVWCGHILYLGRKWNRNVCVWWCHHLQKFQWD